MFSKQLKETRIVEVSAETREQFGFIGQDEQIITFSNALECLDMFLDETTSLAQPKTALALNSDSEIDIHEFEQACKELKVSFFGNNAKWS